MFRGVFAKIRKLIQEFLDGLFTWRPAVARGEGGCAALGDNHGARGGKDVLRFFKVSGALGYINDKALPQHGTEWLAPEGGGDGQRAFEAQAVLRHHAAVWSAVQGVADKVHRILSLGVIHIAEGNRYRCVVLYF